MANTQQTKRNLTLFVFSLTVSMILTIYEYPTFATSKLHLIFLESYSGSFQSPYVPLKWLPLMAGTITVVVSSVRFLIHLEEGGDLLLSSFSGFELPWVLLP